jgi:anti-anti-sigma factor
MVLVTNDDWAAPEFHVVADASADPPRVTVTGEIDLASCAAFRDALNEAAESGAREIEVDFKHVTFMGSMGIRELVRALQAIDRITVRSPSSIVRRAVETASVGKGLVIVD